MPIMPNGEKDEELKNIPVCDLFYRIAMDIA
jgi:hypothetical protein